MSRVELRLSIESASDHVPAAVRLREVVHAHKGSDFRIERLTAQCPSQISPTKPGTVM